MDVFPHIFPHYQTFPRWLFLESPIKLDSDCRLHKICDVTWWDCSSESSALEFWLSPSLFIQAVQGPGKTRFPTITDWKNKYKNFLILFIYFLLYNFLIVVIVGLRLLIFFHVSGGA